MKRKYCIYPSLHQNKANTPSLRRLCSLGLNKGMMECRFLHVGLRDVNLQRLHQPQTPHPCLYCTLKGTFIHLSTSPPWQPKLFPINSKPGGWGALSQSLLRLMIILQAPWKRGTPSEWLVQDQWALSHGSATLNRFFSAPNAWVLLGITGIVPATNGVSI